MIDGLLLIVVGMVLYIIVRGIWYSIQKKRQRKTGVLKEFVIFLFVTYILMVISVTLFPVYIGMPHERFSFYSINFIPLVTIFDDINQIGKAYDGDTLFMLKLIIKNVGGNILMFMPLGFLLPILRQRFRSIKNILLVGLLASVTIESLQFVQLYFGLNFARAVDIDDLICNVFGALLGYLVFKLFRYLLKRISPA